MPNLQNARKALRQTAKRTVHNQSVRDAIAYLRRQYKLALQDADVAKTREAFRALQKALDRAAESGIMKDNTVSRLKARAAQKLNAKA